MTAVPILAVIPMVVVYVLLTIWVCGLLVLSVFWTINDARQDQKRQVERLSRSVQRMSPTRRRRLPGWMVQDGAKVTTRRERLLLRLCQQLRQFCEQLVAENERLKAENANLCVERSATDALLGRAMDALKREQPGGRGE